MFRESEFTWNHLDIWPKVALRSSWNLSTFWPVINMLVSSANNIGIALCNIAFGKSMYRRKRSGPKTVNCLLKSDSILDCHINIVFMLHLVCCLLNFSILSSFFTFCGMCIVIYLHNKDQQDILFFLNLFQ